MSNLISAATNGSRPGPVVTAQNGTKVNGVTHTGGLSKNQLRRMKNKAKKQAGGAASGTESDMESVAGSVADSDMEDMTGIVPPTASSSLLDEPEVDLTNPAYAAFASIFEKFQPSEGDTEMEEVDEGPKKAEIIYSDEDDDDEEDRENAIAKEVKKSKKQLKKEAKLSVAELKTLVTKPEVVEWFDCDARDPRLLVEMKSLRNTVPVPVHWSAKREYLQGKRGIEKPAFQLPPWIADTGIADQRDAVKEKDANMSLKQKTRERVQPKMGKIDIDYQKLHDAFFKFQTMPSMSRFGEAYYEGKELETDLRMKKPGEISDDLKEALSIPPLAPPPWLIAMQRFGPPPSYPNMRIRGLNAPIPEGAQWGFHPGGWGRPPVDEYQRPLYGDPFGVLAPADNENSQDIERELWGTLDPEAEESEEEDEDEEEEEDDEVRTQAPADGLETPSGMDTPSGYNSVISTVPGGLETPDFMDLRKSNNRTESESAPTPLPRELYQVVPERQTNSRGFMGSSTAYDIGAVSGAAGGPKVLGQDDRGQKRKAGQYEVSVDPDQLEGLSQEELQSRYDAARATSTSRVHVPGADVDRQDFGDVIAKETAKRSRTGDREKDRGKSGKEKEKFKF